MAESQAVCTSDSKICAAKRVLEQNLVKEDQGGVGGESWDASCTQPPSGTKRRKKRCRNRILTYLRHASNYGEILDLLCMGPVPSSFGATHCFSIVYSGFIGERTRRRSKPPTTQDTRSKKGTDAHSPPGFFPGGDGLADDDLEQSSLQPPALGIPQGRLQLGEGGENQAAGI